MNFVDFFFSIVSVDSYGAYSYDMILPASEYNGGLINSGPLPNTVNKLNNLPL